MDIFLTLSLMIIPFTMLFIGTLWKKHPPKKINRIYGYRTRMSMKNMETWEFAHKYIGRLWYALGGIAAVLTSIFILVFMDSVNFENITLILQLGQLTLLIGSIFSAEAALRKNFDKRGFKKDNS
ncbi:MAG: SdpI family protein [Lachnospiraceae bacterium]|nr:SdpI family protein [Lachnospiraceae bacterium]